MYILHLIHPLLSMSYSHYTCQIRFWKEYPFIILIRTDASGRGIWIPSRDRFRLVAWPTLYFTVIRDRIYFKQFDFPVTRNESEQKGVYIWDYDFEKVLNSYPAWNLTLAPKVLAFLLVPKTPTRLLAQPEEKPHPLISPVDFPTSPAKVWKKEERKKRNNNISITK